MKPTASMQIFDDLHAQINSGELSPGMLLPSENSLAQKYSASRPTVRKAINRLSQMSLIVRQQGIGSVVSGAEAPAKSLVFAIDLESSGMSDFYYQKFIKGILEVVEAGEHKLRLFTSEMDLNSVSRDVDGFICCQARNDKSIFDNYARLAREGKPVILLNRLPPNPELSYIAVDYYHESFLAMNRLIKNGARHIITYAPESYPHSRFAPRIEGWRQAYRENGLEVPEEYLVHDESPSAIERLKKQLKSGKIDVLYVTQGLEFFSAIGIVLSMGLRIPEDISIFCFDDMEQMGERFNIPISYVKMPLVRMGRMAVEHLISRLT